MAEYHHIGHRIDDLKYHWVWMTKSRFPVRKSDAALRCRDLIREIGQAREVISPALVRERPSAERAFQAGAVTAGEIVTKTTGGMSEPAKALLGPASMGEGILLRHGGSGG